MLKKIGIDTRCLLEKNKSGVGEYTQNLINALLRIDKENKYFFFSEVRICGLHFPNKLLNASLKFFKYPKIDKLLTNALDVFITPNLNFISLSKKCKKIIIVHDISFEIYPEFYSLKSRLWHKFVNLKKLCQEADVIIAVSKNTARDLNDIYNIPRDKIKVIYPGVETRQCLVSTKKENFILYLGNIEPRKNIEGLIQAFESLHHGSTDLQLVIAGSLGFKSKKIRQLAEKHKNIKFLGYVSPEERIALYKSAKLFVFPSFYEGFGFPPLEAMAQGTPIISSISSSLVEVIGNAGILVDSYNINELAWAMNEMLTNQKLREEMIRRGHERVKMFSWEKTAEKILKII
ncbi:MAG: glycosyltransferase family 1 protein [Patescibacteria group bacterium]|nr:glycosyltransferase family 1 protein [Patescibacteria group bacterium]